MEVPVSGPMRYADAVLSVKDQVVTAGQMCIKNSGYMVKNEIKAVRLL